MAKRTVDDITKKMAELAALKRRLMGAESRAERKRKTKQAIIIGTYVMKHHPAKVEAIVATLTRPQDLAAFGIVKDAEADAGDNQLTPKPPEQR